MKHPTANDQSGVKGSGYDAARSDRKDDHLNRWPFAQEIYRIAATGPRDWSVRVGVYGEWGSGKTSVLHFVESMARVDDHVVFSFNPWQYQSTEDLWKAFVEGLFSRIEELTKTKSPGSRNRQAKAVAGYVTKPLPTIVSLWKQEAGDVAKGGLGLLRKYLIFSADDLKQLTEILGKRRLIVTIDDLDRTDARFVPEILFALKDIMDVPGMAFICAFDPVVVGKLLGGSHAGFGDGMKFLEKIIDYPRWLPQPTKEQLASLAVADVEKFYNFVPSRDLDETIALLPKNPRAIRKFIRLIALMEHQIQRHHPYEIQWPILLAANVLKIQFPKLSHEILEDTGFWDGVYKVTFMGESEDNDIKTLVAKKITSVISHLEKQEILDEKDLIQSVTSIASRLNARHGHSVEYLRYQFHLAEAPCAVTWKEFDSFVEHVEINSASVQPVLAWVEQHSETGGAPKDEVYSEVLSASIKRRLVHLEKAADAVPGREMNLELKNAAKLLDLIEVLMIKIPESIGDTFSPDSSQISKLFDQIEQYFAWRSTPAYRSARRNEERLLKRIFKTDLGSIEPWLEIVGLKDGYRHHPEYGDEWKALIKNFRETLRDRCSLWLISQLLKKAEFLRNVLRDEKHGYLYMELFFDLEGPVWNKHQRQLLSSLRIKTGNTILQTNGYEILSWLESLVTDNREYVNEARSILQKTDFATALWKACVSEPLNPKAVGSLRDARDILVSFGIECETPAWWCRIVKGLPKKTRE